MAEQYIAIGLTLLLMLVTLGPAFFIEFGSDMVDVGKTTYDALDQSKKEVDKAEQILVDVAYETAPDENSKKAIQQMNDTLGVVHDLQDAADTIKKVDKLANKLS
jgi:hypothetical protein